MCNSSSSVLVLNRTSPSVQDTFVVDTLLNFLLPFNIPVILAYINSSRVNQARSRGRGRGGSSPPRNFQT